MSTPHQNDPSARRLRVAVDPDGSEAAEQTDQTRDDAPRSHEDEAAASGRHAQDKGPRRSLSQRFRAWLSATVPGHENAVMGGVAGLVVAILLFALGFWRTLLVVVLVLAGIAVGQQLDGDPQILDFLKNLMNNRDNR